MCVRMCVGKGEGGGTEWVGVWTVPKAITLSWSVPFLGN